MSGFEFKQFKVQQLNTAMKVSTDGILLGAWVNLQETKHVLDIGCGTGLLSLMCKQRKPNLYVDAVEIDSGAISDARNNIAQSPWPDVQLHHTDIKSFCATIKYDLVICNPPYFNDSLKGQNQSRNIARHTDSLSFQALLEAFIKVSHRTSRLVLILPCKEAEQFVAMAKSAQLFLLRHGLVSSTSEKAPTRSLMELGFCKPQSPQVQSLCIYQHTRNYSPEYIALCKDFYLKM
ncbi:tRNA1(Val) (adenine(37)-N6)-methyltransferase [Pseudoalteromonas holothuriae]|uniref:tRNA1(Val) (adenine(37)-N6)-methyltransferase n=1 Tax=Pseudoalteromonas holothuriae TaxID=2963714 RepID=A0ABN8UUQ5_9GAMM|nr:methyltransferase [Pseudoalteromonas sp. CIP111951]CAH9067419.1 tRNA1(Val) (adenine(37)-N6)-methyltransferase [Pseudoalteromonas sp. CIP111951]